MLGIPDWIVSQPAQGVRKRKPATEDHTVRVRGVIACSASDVGFVMAFFIMIDAVAQAKAAVAMKAFPSILDEAGMSIFGE
jgi:hypothetical protein